MSLISESLGMSRQNLYKTYLHRDLSKENTEQQYKQAIEDKLLEKSGLSGSQVRRELSDEGVHIPRDRFYRLVNRNRYTLNSSSRAWKTKPYKSQAASNLIKNRTFRRVFEVLFADYTEIKTDEGPLQLLLMEDLVSRYVTSYQICDTCKAWPVVEALEESMALKARLRLKYQTILHTDRGSEFVNHAVKNTVLEYGIQLSNTGNNHCYDNAYIESLNKTLKYTMGLRIRYKTKEEAKAEIREIINQYNTAHKHSSLGKRIPYCVLTRYTAKKSRNPEVKPGSCHPAGRVARTYAKSLAVKIKKNNLDKNKTTQK
ncbi:MAG: IS3 family transposase [Candidatus Syntrophosphaera sp.]|nr:IS3 family transposase [Candidatus Syntrophosphaera sp.]